MTVYYHFYCTHCSASKETFLDESGNEHIGCSEKHGVWFKEPCDNEEFKSDESLDTWTGRPSKWECICLRSAHPHCPQHGLYRRDDVPLWMRVG